MKRLGITAALMFTALIGFNGSAAAQAARTFVSGHGTDTGTCGLTAPCRSFTYALGQTNSGGEITVLDPAGYGAVTINKAINIVNDGIGEAGVTVATSVDAITVSAPNSAIVTLRGLTLVGGNVGNSGITVTDVGTLNVQNCTIGGFELRGINFTAGGPATFNLHVANTVLVGNAGGIFVSPSGVGGTTNVSIERSQATGSFAGVGFGVFNSGNNIIHATVSDSTADGTSGIGFSVGSSSTGTTVLNVVNSRALNNTTGVEASGSGVMFLSQSTVSGNATGYSANTGGIIHSLSTNVIGDNGANGGSLNYQIQGQ